ncbi:neuropilin-1a-like [Ptychodera flava]|uniref:neuropilin-1a-like n=1 Tax=Ptychodera flava TaxID=63121 RepID=UPI00396A370D
MFTDTWITCIFICVMYSSKLCRIGAYEYPTPCDFDHSLCQWQQLDDDDFDWTLQSGNTPSGSTGPSSDHTQGSGGSGQYLYIEASSNYGKTARLVSSPINPSLSDPCTMVFHYHMYGTNIGNLQILFRYEGETNETSLWYKTGNQGNSWNQGSVSFYGATRPFQVLQYILTHSDFSGNVYDLMIG